MKHLHAITAGRRRPIALTLLLLASTALPAAAQWAHTTNNGAITITRYLGRETNLVVPETLNGWPVARVAAGAFQFAPAQYVTRSITFPPAITNLGVAEFNSYQLLTNVTFLGPIQIIPDGAFIGCRNLVAVHYPDSVTRIGQDAFQGCVKLAAVNLPPGLTHVGARAFTGCLGLAGVTLPEGLGQIGQDAFSPCPALTKIRIPASVSSLGARAFANCASLAEIEVDPLNSHYASVEGVLFNKDKTALIQCPGGKTGIFAIPDGITSLPEGAFSGCAKLTGVVIPDSVTTLGRRVFADCSALAELTLPAGIQAIPNGAFSGCRKLSGLALPAGLTSVGSQAFAFSGITNLVIPDGVTAIQDETFRDCPELTSVTIPQGVRTIGHQAFAGCPKLTVAAIPATVTTLQTSAFMDCTSLAAITVDAANPAFASVDGVLFNKSLSALRTYPAGRPGDYEIPASVRRIEDTAFSGAAHLRTLVIPDDVAFLGSGAFQNCARLFSIRLGRGITVIPNAAFSGCLELTEVHLPDTLRTISDLAFSGCRDLRRLTIPASVRTLGVGVFEPYFGGDWPPPLVESLHFEGNAPTAGMQALVLQPSEWGPKVYHRAGTTGWREEFAGRPVVLWDPRVAFDAAFGIRDGRFGCTLNGTPGLVIVVETAPDPASPAWTVLATLTLTDGRAEFSDPAAADAPARLYRFRSP
jgi:hypothetical protein